MTDPHHSHDQPELTEVGAIHPPLACSVLAEGFRELRAAWFDKAGLYAATPSVREVYDTQTDAMIAGKPCAAAPRNATEVLQ